MNDWRNGLVWLTAAIWLGIGTAGLLAPGWLLAPMGVTATEPTGFAELRAMYGGMEIGLGLVTAWLAYSHRVRDGLWLCIATVGGLGLGRLLGVFVDGSTDPLLLAFVCLECGGGLVGLYAVKTLQ